MDKESGEFQHSVCKVLFNLFVFISIIALNCALWLQKFVLPSPNNKILVYCWHEGRDGSEYFLNGHLANPPVFFSCPPCHFPEVLGVPSPWGFGMVYTVNWLNYGFLIWLRPFLGQLPIMICFLTYRFFLVLSVTLFFLFPLLLLPFSSSSASSFF